MVSNDQRAGNNKRRWTDGFEFEKKKRSLFRYLLAVHQSHQTLAAADVISDPAEGQPVDHGAVVHNVSTEQQLVIAVVEANASSGVAWHVKYRQLSVAQIDDITWRTERKEQCGIKFSNFAHLHTSTSVTVGQNATDS